jgi:hypothetical protein
MKFKPSIFEWKAKPARKIKGKNGKEIQLQLQPILDLPDLFASPQKSPQKQPQWPKKTVSPVRETQLLNEPRAVQLQEACIAPAKATRSQKRAQEALSMLVVLSYGKGSDLGVKIQNVGQVKSRRGRLIRQPAKYRAK